MAEAVVSAMKLTFKRDAAAMSLLRYGNIAVKLCGGDEGRDLCAYVYLHIDLMFINPFRPAFHALALVGDQGEAPFDDRRIHVKARLGKSIVLAAPWY